jgi:hypothetical protein
MFMTEAQSSTAVVGSALCSASARIDAWSRLLAGISLAAGALASPPTPYWPALLGGALLAGLIQLVFALRTAFDRPVFEFWTSRSHEIDSGMLKAFDEALVEQGLTSAGKNRPMPARVAGVRRLVLRQTIAFSLQLAAVLVGFCLLLAPRIS